MPACASAQAPASSGPGAKKSTRKLQSERSNHRRRLSEIVGMLDLTLLRASEVPDADREGWIPARIKLADYPQLKQLAWQVHGTDALTPAEALSIYERNWRHVDVPALEQRERQLVDALRLGFAPGHPAGY